MKRHVLYSANEVGLRDRARHRQIEGSEATGASERDIPELATSGSPKKASFFWGDALASEKHRFDSGVPADASSEGVQKAAAGQPGRLGGRYGVLVGNVLNCYDTALFGWTAPFLAPLLFPEKSAVEALCWVFAFLPFNYLAKPLGAFFWGWLGDRHGRKPVIVCTQAGLALATVLIGSLPLNSKAWVLLALCRLFQGFFSAGEKKGAALFLLEHAPEGKRAQESALYDATGILGIFLASFLSTYWGETHWRELFWLSGASGLIAVFLRQQAVESPEFSPANASWKILWEERGVLMKVAIVSGFSYANYYLLSVFLNGYLPEITNLSKKEVLLLNTHLLWVDFFLLFLFGYLCRFIKKELVMTIGALSAALFAIPLFMLLEGASSGLVILVRLMFVVFGVALAAPYHAWKIDILPKKHRFLIGGVGSAIGAKFFGAPIPLMATTFSMQTGCVWMATLPVVILAVAASTVILHTSKILVSDIRE